MGNLAAMVPAGFLRGVGLGLGAAAPIGPVNVEIARRTFRGGWRAGFVTGCGAVTVDCVYLLVSSLSLQPLLRNPSFDLALSAAGGLFLLFLGVQCIRAGWRARQIDPLAGPAGAAADGSGKLSSHYLTGFGLTLLNPMTIAFWFVSVPAAAQAGQSAGRLRLVCLGVFSGAFAWVVFFSSLLSLVRQSRRGVWLVLADMIGGVALLAYGAVAIWRVAARVL